MSDKSPELIVKLNITKDGDRLKFTIPNNVTGDAGPYFDVASSYVGTPEIPKELQPKTGPCRLTFVNAENIATVKLELLSAENNSVIATYQGGVEGAKAEGTATGTYTQA
ncbi:hypothetical protein SCLCIDRAFT_760757 [Scleroderma citrinum Foug A]|uniref:Uncharacterized protein n=1 Tax=Scleroderma citrinum Foug A TaxID=1036808 RepID=A0A0C3E5B5_9AGAM|nr:hypothetical protein SCLCIDRAFT_760757 [Scleroderma citrinum Foug A]